MIAAIAMTTISTLNNRPMAPAEAQRHIVLADNEQAPGLDQCRIHGLSSHIQGRGDGHADGVAQ
ncbi:hypothetical protein [Glutamicibacter nicotianae]|uniref:hypothetical protein n=1 Tax=Glutamicibacter nicotianae TaxID=37929 RepID=UPI001CC0DD08|nr:hypothetical protein [Glutamicibacter nicotianae]